MSQVLTGLDVFGEGYWKRLRSCRLGLLSNQASLDSSLRPAKEVVAGRLPGQLKALFGAQHGHGGEDQDNMVETAHSRDRRLNVPIFSLYAEDRKPLPHMLEGIDALLIDLQDVGTRVYTFASSMLNCLKALSGQGKKVVVLDRPNPLGGDVVEGNLLRPGLFSFVGPCGLPMRHGMTMGELAAAFVRLFDLDCDLEVVPMRGWRRSMFWEETGLRWVMPSPNMPVCQTAYVYPGQVLWEGTNVSEGRGTCRPFEIFGAPFFDAEAILQALPPEATIGCRLQEYSFRPTFHKWAEELCRGFMIHVLDRRIYRPYSTSLSVLKAVIDRHPREFEWKAPPYEYEHEKMPIDLIIGDSEVRRELEASPAVSFRSLEKRWAAELSAFLDWREAFLLYA